MGKIIASCFLGRMAIGNSPENIGVYSWYLKAASEEQSVCEGPEMGHCGMTERKAARVLGTGF